MAAIFATASTSITTLAAFHQTTFTARALESSSVRGTKPRAYPDVMAVELLVVQHLDRVPHGLFILESD
ncbi:UNVERIFIED_CONTAM: hypothetical protein Sradi_3816100 [Sesamum radiatum]|uniref:Secreted protein n=1 Tax=Sesamum radiatum TaxID=300843 RepID=A0AAW2Q0H1_SESRA